MRLLSVMSLCLLLSCEPEYRADPDLVQFHTVGPMYVFFDRWLQINVEVINGNSKSLNNVRVYGLLYQNGALIDSGDAWFNGVDESRIEMWESNRLYLNEWRNLKVRLHRLECDEFVKVTFQHYGIEEYDAGGK